MGFALELEKLVAESAGVDGEGAGGGWACGEGEREQVVVRSRAARLFAVLTMG